MSYEYSKKKPLSGMGWSEVGITDGLAYARGWCSGSDKDRRICSTSDPGDIATMQAAGCIRPRTITNSNLELSCSTRSTPSNPGTVWCCPQNRPANPSQVSAAQANTGTLNADVCRNMDPEVRPAECRSLVHPFTLCYEELGRRCTDAETGDTCRLITNPADRPPECAEYIAYSEQAERERNAVASTTRTTPTTTASTTGRTTGRTSTSRVVGKSGVPSPQDTATQTSEYPETPFMQRIFRANGLAWKVMSIAGIGMVAYFGVKYTQTTGKI